MYQQESCALKGQDQVERSKYRNKQKEIMQRKKAPLNRKRGWKVSVQYPSFLEIKILYILIISQRRTKIRVGPLAWEKHNKGQLVSRVVQMKRVSGMQNKCGCSAFHKK
jgi:hypothetical protein